MQHCLLYCTDSREQSRRDENQITFLACTPLCVAMQEDEM